MLTWEFEGRVSKTIAEQRLCVCVCVAVSGRSWVWSMHSCRPTSVWTGCLQGLSTALSRNTDTSPPELPMLGCVYTWVFIRNYYMAVLPPWKRFLRSTRLSENHTVPLISALAIEAKTHEESLQCSVQFCIWIVLRVEWWHWRSHKHSFLIPVWAI